MTASNLNLFIVNNDPAIVTTLHNYLEKKFGPIFNVSVFNTGREALEKVDRSTQVVVLDNYLVGENGTDVRKSIKTKNPYARVIMYKSNEDAVHEINRYREITPVNKGEGPGGQWSRIGRPLHRIFTYPIHFLVKEFGVNKFVAIFLLSFITVLLVVYIAMQIIQ